MLLPSAKDPVESVARIAAFAQEHPGAVAAIEGPNEINIWPVTYAGLTGVHAAVAFVDAAAGAAAAAPSLAGVDIYDLTGAPRDAVAGDAANYANIHPYPQRGAQPYQAIASRMALHGIAGKGMVITEAGYHTGVGNPTWEGVDETTQAKLTLNLIADATKLGVAQTYLYELLDIADPTGIDAEKNFGLFDSTFQPKPVATAIHNLTAILADNATDALRFATHEALKFTLNNAPANTSSVVMEKTTGVQDLMLWSEPDIWNEKTDRPIAVAVKQTVVDFGRHVDVVVYDPLVSDQPLASYHDVSTIKVALSDHPVILEVAGAADGPTGTPVEADPALWLTGSPAADTIVGLGGNDMLKGLAGNDLLEGAAGDDILYGGLGADVLMGGPGADLFVFQTAGDSRLTATTRDQIRDFNAAEGDRIGLTGIDANSQLAGNQAFTLAAANFSHSAGELIQTYIDEGMLLQGDQNGDGRADFSVLLAGLTQPLDATSFLL